MNKKFYLVWPMAACLLVTFGSGMVAAKSKDKEKLSPEQKQEALFLAMDEDKDGKVSEIEYVSYYKVKAEKKFKKLDKDGDTYLVKEEIVIKKLPKKSKTATE